MLKSWRGSWHLAAYTAFALTDQLFHGYLYYSPVLPITAKILLPRRGLWCPVGDYWWPMPLTFFEQIQPGSTYLHTFLTSGLTPGQTYYIMLFCSADPTYYASTSLIWAITVPQPPYYNLLIRDTWTS